jgi:hypothetical protein
VRIEEPVLQHGAAEIRHGRIVPAPRGGVRAISGLVWNARPAESAHAIERSLHRDGARLGNVQHAAAKDG